MAIQIKRIARGKINDADNLEKEIDNIVKQVENALNKITTNQEYILKNITTVRELDPNNSTLSDVINNLGTLQLDLQSMGLLKVKTS